MRRLALPLAAALLLLPALAAAAEKVTVAVLYFDYDGKSEELALLKKGLAQMLITDLAADGEFTVVERARLQDLLDELKLNQSAKFDAATANRIGKLLGARYLVMGRYFELMGQLRVDARAVETETGRLLRGSGALGKPEDFLELEQRIARELGEALAKVVPAPSKADAPAPPAPARPKAPKRLHAKVAAAYSQALDALDRKEPEAAKKGLEAVLKEQPDFALASAELAGLLR